MKKIKLLPIALLCSIGLSGCNASQLMFWKKSGEQQQQSGEKDKDSSKSDTGDDSTTQEEKIKEIALKSNARTTLSVTEKVSTTAFFEVKANKGFTLKTADRKVIITSSNPNVLNVLATGATVSTFFEALAPGNVKITVQSNIQESARLEFDIVVRDSVFDRQAMDGFFGNNWDNVDFEHEVDAENPYIKTVAEDNVNHQFYFRNSYTTKSYAECEFAFYSEQDGNAHLPKLGFAFSTNGENETGLESVSMIYFDTDCSGGKTTYYNVGYNEIANGIWGWDQAGQSPLAKHFGVYRYEAGIQKGETFTMGVAKDGYNYHVYFNGVYIKSIETTKEGFSTDKTYTEAAPTICGLFDFKSEVKYSNYSFTTDETIVNSKIPETPDYTDIPGN